MMLLLLVPLLLLDPPLPPPPFSDVYLKFMEYPAPVLYPVALIACLLVSITTGAPERFRHSLSRICA